MHVSQRLAEKKDSNLTSMIAAFWKSYAGLFVALLATIIVFLPSLQNGFVAWDDPDYIQNNPLIQDFSFAQIIEIFKTPGYLANYQPLTLVSYAFDYSIADGNATVYHYHNLVLHLLNVGLVYGFVWLLFQNWGMAFIVALLFGIHPMHVESVAWVSGRKDVLYVFYFVFGLIAFLKYVSPDENRTIYFLIALVGFILSCLSKGQAVIFPVVLLLILYVRNQLSMKEALKTIPFFAISVFFGLVAISLQEAGGATEVREAATGTTRIFVSCYTMVLYMMKSIVPFQLSAFHPYPQNGNFPWWIYASIVPMFLLGIWMLTNLRKHQVVFFGLGFFLVSIFLVSQIIPVGRSIISDRYSYLSYLGLFVVIAYVFLQASTQYGKRVNAVIHVLIGLYFLTLGGQAYARCSVWKNSETLWMDVAEKYPDHFMAYSNLGKHYWDVGRFPEAELAFRNCAEKSGHRPEGANNLGLFLKSQRKAEEALASFDQALKIDSNYFPSVLNRGMLLSQLGRNTDALKDMNRMVLLNPDTAISHLFRAIVLENLERYPEAISDYHTLIKREPSNAALFSSRGLVYFKMGELEKALNDYNTSIRLNPNFGEAYYRRSKLFFSIGRFTNAIADVQLATQLKYPVPQEYIQRLMSGQK